MSRPESSCRCVISFARCRSYEYDLTVESSGVRDDSLEIATPSSTWINAKRMSVFQLSSGRRHRPGVVNVVGTAASRGSPGRYVLVARFEYGEGVERRGVSQTA
jgi:hypothetical protein